MRVPLNSFPGLEGGASSFFPQARAPGLGALEPRKEVVIYKETRASLGKREMCLELLQKRATKIALKRRT